MVATYLYSNHLTHIPIQIIYHQLYIIQKQNISESHSIKISDTSLIKFKIR